MNAIPDNSFDSGFDSPSDSRDCIDLIYDGPGDDTVRPLRPSLLRLALAEREKIARYQAAIGGSAAKDEQRK